MTGPANPDEFLDGDSPPSGDELDPTTEVVFETQRDQARREAEEAARLFLMRRMEAYRRLFLGAATPDDIEHVTKDLARFCRATESTYMTDPRDHALLEGRREVWLRILDFTSLSLDDLVERYAKTNQ